MRALVHSEREARDQLLLARDRLADRDAAYAALEADHWAEWVRHEQSMRQRIEELEEALRAARAETVRLQVRLQGVVASAPYRLYARLSELPLMRQRRVRRTNRFEEHVRSRLDG